MTEAELLIRLAVADTTMRLLELVSEVGLDNIQKEADEIVAEVLSTVEMLGVTKGKSAGYDEGYNEGYSDGYSDGYEDRAEVEVGFREFTIAADAEATADELYAALDATLVHDQEVIDAANALEDSDLRPPQVNAQPEGKVWINRETKEWVEPIESDRSHDFSNYGLTDPTHQHPAIEAK